MRTTGGYGIKVGSIAHVIYGPKDDNLPACYGDDFLIRHEFLHSIINPLVETAMTSSGAENSTSVSAKLQKHSYSDLRTVIAEYLIGAIAVKYAPCGPSEKKEMLNLEIRSGFTDIELVYKKLKNSYRKNEFVDVVRQIVEELIPSLKKSKR